MDGDFTRFVTVEASEEMDSYPYFPPSPLVDPESNSGSKGLSRYPRGIM